MIEEKIQYKNITIRVINKNIILINLIENGINDEYSFIMGISQFNEYVGYHNFDYVIFDKKELVIEPSNIQLFLKTQGVDQLLDYGIKKILFIVNNERYEILKNTQGYRGIKAFLNLKDALEEIQNFEKSKTLKPIN